MRETGRLSARPAGAGVHSRSSRPFITRSRTRFTMGGAGCAGAGVHSRSSHLFIADEPSGKSSRHIITRTSCGTALRAVRVVPLRPAVSGTSLGNAHHERPFGQVGFHTLQPVPLSVKFL